jgi:ParB family chromosome partitioning protein
MNQSKGPQIVLIKTSLVTPNPYQPRKTFSEEALEDLIYSIKEKGILMPLIVSKTPAGRYELIAGERRYRAAKALKIESVPVIIRRVSTQDKLELAIIENVQRQQLNPLDEARSYYLLKEEFGLSQDAIAKRMGKPRSTIANSLRLLTLPAYIQEALVNGDITQGHAKLLLPLSNDKKGQKKLFNTLTRENLSVVRTAGIAKKTFNTKKSPAYSAEVKAWQNEIGSHLSAKAIINGKKNGGTISIEYYSIEELKNIVDRILGRE